jgi:hypothetical protein
MKHTTSALISCFFGFIILGFLSPGNIIDKFLLVLGDEPANVDPDRLTVGVCGV